MQANRATSQKELALRRELWRIGVRGYRVRQRLPGRPDLVFPKLRLAVFVHGCFWHDCPTCRLPKPKANAEFWAAKMVANVERDARATRELRSSGWDVAVIWEHDLRRDLPATATHLASDVAYRRLHR